MWLVGGGYVMGPPIHFVENIVDLPVKECTFISFTVKLLETQEEIVKLLTLGYSYLTFKKIQYVCLLMN